MGDREEETEKVRMVVWDTDMEGQLVEVRVKGWEVAKGDLVGVEDVDTGAERVCPPAMLIPQKRRSENNNNILDGFSLICSLFFVQNHTCQHAHRKFI